MSWAALGYVAKVRATVQSQPDYVTALSVNTPGRLLGIGHFSGAASGASFFTIDGLTTAASTINGINTSWRWEFVSGSNTQIFGVTTTAVNYSELRVFFKTSLLVRHSSVDANVVATTINYEVP